jgi:hypothetical protein
MTDNEIKFAISSYLRSAREYKNGAIVVSSTDMIAINDLINRQQAEIEIINDSIQYANEVCENCQSDKDKGLKKARKRAIKEFAERLKEKAHTQPIFDTYCGNKYMGDVSKVYVADIDNLVKEMAGEE